MKDQYFGDINDYRKYGLLRVIGACSRLRLFVAWMLTPDDGSTDGKFVSYLDQPSKWKRYDPDLFWGLKGLLDSGGKREVEMIERSNLLGNAGYFSKIVPDQAVDRRQWFESLQKNAAPYDFVFLDPDNGLEVNSKPYGGKNSAKFLYWREVEALWSSGKSLLIYQHFIREKRIPFIQRMLESLASNTPGSFVELFSTPRVVFLMALQPVHQSFHSEIVEYVQEAWEGQIKHWEFDSRPTRRSSRPLALGATGGNKKSMKITEEQVKAAYRIAKRVYAGEIAPRDGASELHQSHGLNINSARDFIEDYKALIHGKVFQRAMSAPAMEYFLTNIEKDRGRKALSSSLDALRKHITYYENVSQTNLHKMRGVVARFAQRIDQPLGFEQLQTDFAQAVEDVRALPPEERARRLKAAPRMPVRSSAIVSMFLRNPYVVAAVLDRANGTCERCHKAAPFLRGKDGTPYLEVHHKKRLADKGEDSVDNAFALCPNCHRELHHGPHAQQNASSDVVDYASLRPGRA